MNNELNNLSEQISNKLRDNDKILSFIFCDDDPQTGNVILSKKGNDNEIAENIAALLLSGIHGSDEELKEKTQSLFALLENALLITMMEDEMLYERVTTHILKAKNMCDMQINSNTPMA